MTEPEPLQQVDRTYVCWRGRKLSYFSGCDYFRLASHPKVLCAVRDGLHKFGLNVAASRLTTGNHKLYRVLEERLAAFFKAEAALVVPSGCMAATTAAQALAGKFSHAMVDERAHPALLEAGRSLDCPVHKFKHRDEEHFAAVVSRCGRGARIIVLTDGMFSHDGSIAPLHAYLRELPADGMIVVDDAHGAGVAGKTGQGTLESENVSRRRVIQCITLSKAFGCYGGAVLGSADLRRRIMGRSRLFVGSTPLPLPLVNGALAAIGILQRNPSLRRRLQRNASHVRAGLREAGIGTAEISGPIIAIPCSRPREAERLCRRLLSAGIYPPFVKYPGGPCDGSFRFVISSEHSGAQLDNLLSVLG